MSDSYGGTLDGHQSLDAPFPVAEYLGPWPSFVVDTADPEKRGRIRARAPQVWGDPTEDEFIPDAELPWAWPAFPTHDLHVPSVGDGVILQFWGGDPAKPVWIGQFLGDGDIPSEFASSYTPEPKTRLIRTANGHQIEMRWVSGEEKIRVTTAGLAVLEMLDITTPEGPKISMTLPDLKRIEIDGKTQAINVTAPTGQINVTALAGAVTVTGQGVTVASTGTAPTVNTGGGALSSNFVGAAAYVFGGVLAITVVGLTTLTLAGVTLAGGALAIAGAISLGVVGAKYRAAHARIFQLLQDILFVQSTHTHGVTTAPGTTGISNITTAAQIGVAPRAGPLTNVPVGVISSDVNDMSAANLEVN